MASGQNGTNESCTNADELVKRYYLPVSYTVIFAVGAVGNVTSIAIYLTKVRPWNSTCVVMVNLAFTDLLYVLTLPFLVYYYVNGDTWTLGAFMCRFIRFTFHFNLYSSVLFLTCLAAFRYAVVTRPLEAARLQRKRWGAAACAAVWAIAAAELAPLLTMITVEQHGDVVQCLDLASSKPAELIWWYSWLLTALGFLLPLAVVAGCCVGVARRLATGPHGGSAKRRRVRRMMALIMAVFVVCFLPFHVLRALRVYTRLRPGETPCALEHGAHAAYIVSRPLAAFNTFFNLILYTLAGSRFQKAFLGTFCWKRAGFNTITTPNAATINTLKLKY